MNRKPRLKGNTKPRAVHNRTNKRPLERYALPGEIDTAFLERSSMVPLPSSRGPVRLPDGDSGYGPVKILDGDGNVVRIVSVAELGKRRGPVVMLGDWVGAKTTFNARADRSAD